MSDVENVISDLEEQITWIRDNDSHKFPGWGHAVLAMRAAIAMLKAQEPVRPISCKSYIHTEPITFDYECPICMTGIMRNWVACQICGQAVKWE